VSVCTQVAASGLVNIESILPPPHFLNAQQSAVISAQHQQLMQIYRETLNIAPECEIQISQPFTQLGLRPAHVKAITGQINQTFALALNPRQLIGCRNIEEVAQLINTAIAMA
ncbi:MAG: phosphopantetheine-binding protein, partial [Snodgrassella alvi]|nr:phosphopantetheine-binding protein [Snodgrassella alvi]